ncbi:ABC transporter permease [Amycolatopsis sp. CA-230715]|uniref:ABC transporter permease n=1 Tax=Amycolatopsis sp. CA-230715 TaxID=2745196 RepID=UPI001C02AE17|nr:ABC transporter permease [Amycolatopsis sp. CA-230715]
MVSLIVAMTGGDLVDAVAGWFHGAAGTPYSALQTLAYAVPLALIALGASPALRAGVVVVGAEGQLVVGAIAATALMLSPVGRLPGILALPLGAGAGIAGGVLWAMIPAVPQVRWRVSEILSALMANYIATHLLSFLLRTSLRDPDGFSAPRSADLPSSALIPFLPVPGRLTTGVLIVVVAAGVGLWWRRTRSALVLDVFAEQRWLAARLGGSTTRVIIGTTALSGAAAGLTGWLQVAGVDGRLTPGVAGGIGFTGLVVAVLGRFRPIPIMIAALLMASLFTGANGIQMTSAIPASIGTVTQGVLLLAVAAAVTVARRSAPNRGGMRE